MTYELPYYIYVVFLLTVIAAFLFLYFGLKKADTSHSNSALITSVFLGAWLFFVGVLSLNNFFFEATLSFAKFSIALIPPIIVIILVLSYKKSRHFLMGIPITTFTYLHIIRIPIEIIIWWMALEKGLPMILTFEGSNYDILSGITAPFVAIFMVGLRSKAKFGAIVWNVLALVLLINFCIKATLSAPFSFQRYGFDHPNVAIFQFPFVWLPAFIVPAILFAHFTSLIKLISRKEENL